MKTSPPFQPYLERAKLPRKAADIGSFPFLRRFSFRKVKEFKSCTAHLKSTKLIAPDQQPKKPPASRRGAFGLSGLSRDGRNRAVATLYPLPERSLALRQEAVKADDSRQVATHQECW